MPELLDLGNIVRVSVSGPSRGLPGVNTSALAIITDEVPIPNDFGTSRTYLNADGVATDFGSNSETYALARDVFNQKQNILAGGGYLLVIPRLQTALAQPATILGSSPVNLNSLTALDYSINVDVDGGGAADLVIGEIDRTSISTVLASLNSTAVTAAGLVFTISGTDLASAIVTLKTIADGATKTITVGLVASGTDIAPLLNISGSATGADAGVERVKDAVLRTKNSVPYFGIVLNEKQTDANLIELAATVQSMDKLLVVGSNLEADILGVFKTISDSGYTHTRCVIYTVSESDSLSFAAGYLSILMSINFFGSNTMLTMHLKDFTGLPADPDISQTDLDSCAISGVDFLGNFGVPKIFTSGANLFADQIYTRLALKVNIQIAIFNYLAQTTGAIPQTEQGMDGMKTTVRGVMNRFVSVGVCAPGEWQSATTFGPSPEDHRRNIREFGYYIYSSPIATQAQSQREARIAPLIQDAYKEKGAYHSADVSILVEP